MKTVAVSAAILVLALVGCGGGSGEEATAPHGETGTGPTTSGPVVTGRLPSGAAQPADPEEQAAEGPAATEASPGVPAVGPGASGELSDANSSAVSASVSNYIQALDRHDAGRACALFAPGALDLSLLPKRHGGCVPSLRASIGTRPRGGGPAWRKTTLVEVQPEDLGGDRARVSATVTHHFSDRKYVSVEDDVIYLERASGRWRLAKASATLYRAVGYESPPLEAFKPPAGW